MVFSAGDGMQYTKVCQHITSSEFLEGMRGIFSWILVELESIARMGSAPLGGTFWPLKFF